jgi:Zn-dependent M28 family amino/carboxypeptidase
MEAARVLARYAADILKCTVRFIAFGCEEMGMIGSQSYVEAHEGELDNIRMFLNFDAAGAIGVRKIIFLHHWPELEPFFRSVVKEADFSAGRLSFRYGDSFAFFLRGVPTASLKGPEEPFSRGFGHTFYDTLDKVGLVSLREASAIAARVALRVANVDDFPARRRSQETVQEIINTNPALEGYRIEKELATRLREAP